MVKLYDEVMIKYWNLHLLVNKERLEDQIEELISLNQEIALELESNAEFAADGVLLEENLISVADDAEQTQTNNNGYLEPADQDRILADA